MSSSISRVLSAGLLGAAVGSLLAARWVAVGRQHLEKVGGYSALITPAQAGLCVALVMLLIAIVYMFARTWSFANKSLLAGILSSIGAIGIFVLLAATATHAPYGLSPMAARLILLGVIVVMMAGRARPRRFMPLVTLAILGYMLPTHPISAIFGDNVAFQSISYSLAAPWQLCADVMVTTAFAGLVMAQIWAMLVRSRDKQGAVLGIVYGAASGIMLLAIQATGYFIGMGSGCDPFITWLGMTVVAASLSMTIALAKIARERNGVLQYFRYTPAIVLVVLSAYLALCARGSGAYFSIRGLHGDTTYAYIHYTNENAHLRTLDYSGRSTTARRMTDFLRRFPKSAYRPAALLTKAECEFDLWRFKAAAGTLDMLIKDYPHMVGYPYVLRGIAHFAAGRPEVMLESADMEALFTDWRRGPGALLTGVAAERAGQPMRAVGFHSAYVDYLMSKAPTAWSRGSMQYSNGCSDGLLLANRHGTPKKQAEEMIIRVDCAGKPVSNVRVALVQPHRDAAFPADSSQFTGAWSVPAWNGVAGVTGASGIVTLRNVPYGDYDLVLGLDRQATPRDMVFAAPLSRIRVQSEKLEVPRIRLVPAITQIYPKQGGSLSLADRLRWQPYPGAVSYSASVIHLRDNTERIREVRERLPGTTCWARAGIREASATIDRKHFVNGYTRLQRGGVYIWIIYAYGRHGEVLSTSEHYFELSEPWFKVL